MWTSLPLLLAFVACQDGPHGTSTTASTEPVDTATSPSPTVPPVDSGSDDTSTPTEPPARPCTIDEDCPNQACRGSAPGVAGSGTCQDRLALVLPEGCL